MSRDNSPKRKHRTVVQFLSAVLNILAVRQQTFTKSVRAKIIAALISSVILQNLEKSRRLSTLSPIIGRAPPESAK
jgi:hypothetical protein